MRSGRYLEALGTLNGSVETHQSFVSRFATDSVGDEYLIPFIAIIHHKLGHSVEAREHLAKAMSTLRSIESKGVGVPTDSLQPWNYALAVKLVTLEAKAIIESGKEDLPSDPIAH